MKYNLEIKQIVDFHVAEFTENLYKTTLHTAS